MRIFLTFSFFLLFGVGIQAQKIYRINTENDVDDGSCDNEHCSLREAINAANTDGIPSILWFEILGEGTKVITLASDLPAITEHNLTIDGNTLAQNLPTTGRLVIDGNEVAENGFNIQSTDVRIFGLQMQNFLENAVVVASSTMDTISRVTIGRRRQGNIFIKNGNAVKSENVNRLIFQANYVGTNHAFDEGLGNRNGIIVMNNWSSYENAVIRIGGSIEDKEHNYFASSSVSAINISYQGSAKIEGNIFGTGEKGTEQLGNNVAVRTRNHRGRIDIGGSTDTKNTFAFNQTAVIVDDNNFVRVSENSFYCNAQGLTVTNNAHPIPVIESGIETILVGTAQPNDFVEVYITDAQTCNSSDCQGMIYVGTVKASTTGDWQFPGFFEFGQQMVALSRNNGRQSMFSECFRICPGAVRSEVSNTGPYCENDTIQLKTEVDVYGFQWVTSFTPDDMEYEWTGPDGFVAYVQNPKTDGKPGEYILTTYLLGCPSEPDTTEVFITSLKAEIEPISPACRADSLTINTLISSNIDNANIFWTGPNNYQSTEPNPTDIKASGTYNLLVEGEGCQSEIVSVEIVNDFPESFSLGDVQQVCKGSGVALNLENFDHFQWSGDYDLDCDTCNQINFIPTQNGTVTLNAGPTSTCFSTATIDIEVVQAINNYEERMLCAGSSLNLLNQTIDQAGEYTATYTAANGCDSTQTYLVVQAEENMVYESKTICEGDVLLQFGQNYTSSGTYQAQFTAANGCDSTHVLELTVLQGANVTEQYSVCAGESMSIFGEDVNESTTVSKTFTAANGCDSIHTVSLFVKETYQDVQQLVLCAGEVTEIFNGLEISKSGYYQRDFVSSNGCDSIAAYEVEVLESIETYNHITMCDDEALALFGSTNAFPGDYSETFSSQSGCDSIHHTSYTFNFRSTNEEFVTICGTDNYVIAGEKITASGTYQNTYASANGCDSTHTINVTVIEPTYSFDEYYLCAGASIEVFGKMVNNQGIFSETFTNQNGCDSFHTVTVFIKEQQVTEELILLCEGETITVFDKVVSSEELITKTFSGSNGCDSTHSVQVTILNKIETQNTKEVCQTTCLDLYGADICSDKVLLQTYTSSTGCDSIHTTFLNITDPQSISKEYMLCEGDSLAALGTFIKAAGTYSDNFIGRNGCDSTHTVIVTVTEPISTLIETKPTCGQLSNGQVSLSIIGGFAPYTVNWGGDNMGGINSMTDLAAGEYDLEISDFLGCQFQQKITIEEIATPKIEMEVLDISCFGENDGSVALFADAPVTFQIAGQVYKEDGFVDLGPAEYEVVIKDNSGCEYKETFTIVEPDPIKVELPESIEINLGETVDLEPVVTANNLVNYEWAAAPTLNCLDCKSPTASPLKNTKYTLTIYDDNSCESQAEVWVKIDVNKGIYVPNVFSPNDDGRNDKFTILGAEGPVEEVENFKVFDRWGTLLYEANNFQPNDERYGWNGQFRGQAMDNGVYLYFAVVKFIDGTETKVQGDITLSK